MMKRYSQIFFALAAWLLLTTGCGIYKFNDTAVPPDLKVIKIEFVNNKARYVNPQLGPKLTDRLRQKFNSQTKLIQTSGDNADWVISPEITEYNFSTSAISGQQTVGNRITVSVHLSIYQKKIDKTVDYSVTRNLEFASNQTVQDVESSSRYDEFIRELTDDLFNRIFSDW